MDKKPEIRVLLTNYGLNEDQLKENYNILKQIENDLEKGVKYEVAYDLTHSFRSLPIYNLIIFNYINNLTSLDIDITHVYYGNVEVSRELGYAPIVDLKDLVNVLDLTGAVTEFKDTGNTLSLAELVPNESFKNCLRNFDIATQVNEFSNIKKELINILDHIEKDKDKTQSRYTGISEMIYEVLSERFFDGHAVKLVSNSDGESAIVDENNNEISDTDLKFLLTKWYYSQNRLGLGLATGLEALRDICVAAKTAADGSDERGRAGRGGREVAEQQFISKSKELSDDDCRDDRLRSLFRDLGGRLLNYKEIRNSFAHNLENTTYSIDDIQDKTNEFKELLFGLKSEYDNNREAFIALFGRRAGRYTASGDSCRIIVQIDDTPLDYSDYLTSTTGNSFDVYYICRELRDVFAPDIRKRDITAGKAKLLKQYLTEKIPFEEYDDITVVLECRETDPYLKFIYKMYIDMLRRESKEITSTNKPISLIIKDSEPKISNANFNMCIDIDQESQKAVYENDRNYTILSQTYYQYNSRDLIRYQA